MNGAPDRTAPTAAPAEPAESSQPPGLIPECPICYAAYDNAFQRPLLLPCAHTFCLECLARLCLFLKQAQLFPCPLCRTPVLVPTGGVPRLPTDTDVVVRLPPWMQTLPDIWLEGHRLCWVRPTSPPAASPEMLVTLELLTHRPPLLQRPQPGELVAVHQGHRLPGGRELGQLLWKWKVTLLWILLILTLLVIVPTYLYGFHK
ncbi:E3 ubiquitin-protein ligase RNF183 [Ornithorhynchus anatinus]|uniref:E3 ubiquitin-protein ligase RNF183 n=1 Tax=Ornithorhynchus anatinus TaxID=9258 RepID=UPI0019D4BE45|nr:E3 ubiquitin-protein ligase RNF183 [Ornithorhynchus anatinus]